MTGLPALPGSRHDGYSVALIGSRRNRARRSSITSNAPTSKAAVAVRSSVQMRVCCAGSNSLRRRSSTTLGGARLGLKEEFREIKVLGQQHESLPPRPSEEVDVWGRWRADVAPVAGLPSSLLQNRQPLRAEVHVHKNLQAGTEASSSSSTRTEA